MHVPEMEQVASGKASGTAASAGIFKHAAASCPPSALASERETSLEGASVAEASVREASVPDASSAGTMSSMLAS